MKCVVFTVTIPNYEDTNNREDVYVVCTYKDHTFATSQFDKD